MYSKETQNGQEAMQPRKIAHGTRVFIEKPTMPRAETLGPRRGALMQQAGGGGQ